MELADELADELEDGELGDYSPLQRPELAAARTVPRIQDSSSDDNDEDDSDGPKRPRLKCLPKPSAVPAKYNVWAEKLQEEALTEKLVTCDVVTHDRSRDVESYFIPRFERSSGGNKRSHDGVSVKERLGPRPPPADAASESDDDDDERERVDARHLLELRVTAESEPEDVATDIANKLFEEKDDLVAKVVKVLGIAKTIKLFERTREIEADGGMMILNGARRRTPGGVFFYLTRTASDATRDQLSEIFDEDQRARVDAERRGRRERAKKRRDADVARLRALHGAELPPLPSRADVLIAQMKATREASDDDDEGEIKDGTDSDAEANGEAESPPPPVMETFLPLSSREVASYDDDFLQVDADMDLF